jgi:hypothetical protein
MLLALLMQAIAPYLPMPALGGATSWELAASAFAAPCPEHMAGAGDKAPAKGPQNHPCTVCTVIHQASSTLAAADVAPSCSPAFLELEYDETRDAQFASLSSHAFSSRAPPRAA